MYIYKLYYAILCEVKTVSLYHRLFVLCFSIIRAQVQSKPFEDTDLIYLSGTVVVSYEPQLNFIVHRTRVVLLSPDFLHLSSLYR